MPETKPDGELTPVRCTLSSTYMSYKHKQNNFQTTQPPLLLVFLSYYSLPILSLVSYDLNQTKQRPHLITVV